MIVSNRDSSLSIQANAMIELENLNAVDTEPNKPLSLREYIPAAWSVNEPDTPFVSGWHIDCISEHLEAVTAGKISKLIINVPPGSTKSLTTCVMWPSWMWGEKGAGTKFLFSSYAEKLALRDSTRMRKIIRSGWYQSRYGDQVKIVRGQDTKGRYDTTRGGYRIATTVRGVGTGERADIVVVDDPHKKMDIRSATIREGVNEWWRSEMRTRGTNPSVRFVIIMQRLHDHDLTGFALAEMSGYEHLFIPFRYEDAWKCSTSIGWTDPRTEEDELYWTELYDEDAAQDLEYDLGSVETPGQLQQRPHAIVGEIFKEQWWRYWHLPGMELGPVIVHDDEGNIIEVESVELDLADITEFNQSWDMTFKDTDASAFVCGQEWGTIFSKRANRYLLDEVHAKMDIVKTIQAVRMLKAKWPDTASIWVEDKANGPAVMQTLRDEISGLIGVTPIGDKISRGQANIPQIESGNVYLPHPDMYPWVRPHIAEHTAFPSARYNDRVDTTSQALLKLKSASIPTGLGVGADLSDLTRQSHWIGH